MPSGDFLSLLRGTTFTLRFLTKTKENIWIVKFFGNSTMPFICAELYTPELSVDATMTMGFQKKNVSSFSEV